MNSAIVIGEGMVTPRYVIWRFVYEKNSAVQ